MNERKEPKHPRPDRHEVCRECLNHTGQVNWYDVRNQVWTYFCDKCW